MGPLPPLKPPMNLPNTSRAISTLRSQVCFLSMARDEITWIEGPTLQKTDVPREKGQHLPTLDEGKRPYTQEGRPHLS